MVDLGTLYTNIKTLIGQSAYLKQEVNSLLNSKVDKVSGKGLSTNDFTTAEKNKLAGIEGGANGYTHPSTKQCNYTYSHPSNQQCTHNHSSLYVAKSQGTSNQGKFLKVNSSGDVNPESVTIPSAYSHPSNQQCTHGHTMSEVSNLESTLNAKASTSSVTAISKNNTSWTNFTASGGLKSGPVLKGMIRNGWAIVHVNVVGSSAIYDAQKLCSTAPAKFKPSVALEFPAKVYSVSSNEDYNAGVFVDSSSSYMTLTYEGYTVPANGGIICTLVYPINDY